MKRKITFLIAALMLLTMINLPEKAVGQTPLLTSDLDWGTPVLSENFDDLNEVTNTGDQTSNSTTTISNLTAYGIFNKISIGKKAAHEYEIVDDDDFDSNIYKLTSKGTSFFIASITGHSSDFGSTGAYSIKVGKTDYGFFGLYATDDGNGMSHANASVFIRINNGALHISDGGATSTKWISIGTYTSDIISINVVYNNTSVNASYGDGITLNAKTAHVFVNGECVMNGANPKNFTIPGASLTVFRCYPNNTINSVFRMDDVMIYNTLPTAASSDPTINVSPASLNGFTYSHGNGPSAAQSFSVSGSSLSANLVIAAPTDYELCTTANGTYSESISLTPSSGAVSSTTIYARLKAGEGIGNYNSENVTLNSTGATEKTVALSGSVTGYTLTYSGNGNTSGTVPTDATAYEKGASVTILGNTGSLVKTHYSFGGWTRNIGGAPKTYAAGDTLIIKANTTVNAVWAPITHTFSTAVTPNNSGTVVAKDGGNNTIASGSSVAETAQLTLTASPAEGYNFTSWSDGGNNSTLSSTTTNPTTFTMGTANVTITATFTARTPATVTLHDGLNGATTTVVNTYTDATLADVIEGHDIASVNGWTALGWVKSYTSGTPTLITTSEEVGSTTNLYAVYSKGSNIFTLINDTDDLDLNGNYMIGYGSKIMKNVKSTYYMGYTTSNEISDGSFEYVDGRVFILGGTSGAYTFYDGSKYLSATGGSSYVDNLGLSKSATTNYEKWSIGFSNNTAQITNNGNTDYMVAFRTGNNYDYFNCYTSTSVNLYKQTSSVNYSITPSAEKCHVTYNANGATSGDVPTDEGVYDPNDNVTVKGNTGSLAKTGHTWSGWCLNEAGTGTVYGPTYTTTYAIQANTTFYAKWAVQSYSYELTDDAHSIAELKVGGETYSAATIPYGTEVEVYVETEDDNYLYFISVKDSEDNDVEVEDDTFTMPASDITITVTSRLKYKYELVTSTNQLVAGKHYVIATATSGTAYAMGYQRDSNRGKSAAVSFDNTGKLLEYYDIWDFVLSGDATNGWTLYDKYTEGEGFLCAASSSYNYLKLQTTLDANGKWAISFSSNKATIMAKGSYSRKYMRYNSSSNIFSCYDSGTSQQDIYLFVKYNDDDYEIYSPTPMSGDQTVYSLVVEGTLTIKKGATLEVLDELINDNPANLIIEDGGQLIVNKAGVQATFQKNIEDATAKGIADHWYTISTPTGGINITDVTNLVDNEGHTLQYNLFRYDEPTHMWEAYNTTNHATFTTLEKGRGYLYRNNDQDLAFAGEVNVGDVEDITLYRQSGVAKVLGFNLIGNPFGHVIYKGEGASIDNTDLGTGFYYLNDKGGWQTGTFATPITPMMGILVQVVADKTSTSLTIGDDTTEPSEESKYANDNLMFTVANSQYEDVTYAMFHKGYGLNKINHRNADIPMLYINHDNDDYAIAMLSDDTKAFNLCFKAKTTGQYKLTYKAESEFSYLHIIDRLTGNDVDMLLEGEYSFIGTPHDNANRFIVSLGYLPDYGEDNNDIFAFQSGSDILVSGQGELQIFDVTGRMVNNMNINGVESINVQSQGVYILRLVGTEVKTQKIVVK